MAFETLATPLRQVSTALRKPLRVVAAIPAIYFILAVLLIWISYENPNFPDPPVFLAFLRRASPLVILAAGELFVIVTGGFDLSVGSLITLTVLGGALLTDGNADRTPLAIAVLYLIGIGVGLFNGLVVSYLRVSSFITTLGMLIAIKGAALLWSGGAPAGYLPDNFRVFGRETLQDVPYLGELPYAVIIVVIYGIAATYLLHGTNFGKKALAVGDNPRAAALSGVAVPRVRIVAFVLSSVSAVTAGILLGGFAGVSMNVGDGYELEAIAAVVLGGAMLMGGKGSMPTAMAGALSLRALFTLLNLLGLPSPYRAAVQGLIIIGAATYAAFRGQRES
ncbi:MAG: ABC transporter permease [Aggregatilineaceae bacterium]